MRGGSAFGTSLRLGGSERAAGWSRAREGVEVRSRWGARGVEVGWRLGRRGVETGWRWGRGGVERELTVDGGPLTVLRREEFLWGLNGEGLRATASVGGTG